MKTLLLFLVFTHSAFAENWFPIGKAGARSVYTAKPLCETAEGQRCYEVSNCPQDICIVQNDLAVIDPIKKAQRDARIDSEKAAKVAEESEKKAEVQAVLDACKTESNVAVLAICKWIERQEPLRKIK